MKKYYIIILIIIILLIILGFYLGNISANKDSVETNRDKIEDTKSSITYNITKTNEISKYVPKNINKITITNNLSDENNPTIINIEDINKIEEFMNLIFATKWEEKDKSQMSSNFNGAYYQIEIIGDTKTILNMQGVRRI